VSPEELFRKIFGDAGFNTSAGGFGGFTDFAESAFGFAPAAEVTCLSSVTLVYCQWLRSFSSLDQSRFVRRD